MINSDITDIIVKTNNVEGSKMPNWCVGNLEVNGINDKLMKFYKQAKDKQADISADRFIPYPKRYQLRDKEAAEIGIISPHDDMSKREWEQRRKAFKEKWGSIDDGFNSGGYEWCNEHWGTKWGFCDVVMSGIDVISEDIQEGNGDEQGILIYDFQTAWAPINPVIEKMAEEFPELEFNYKYHEGGMGFRGEVECINGECFVTEGNYVGCWLCGDHVESGDRVTCAEPECEAVICPTCNENYTEDDPWYCMNHEEWEE